MPTLHVEIKDNYSEKDSYFPIDGDYLKTLIKVSPFTQEKVAVKAGMKRGSTIAAWTSYRSLASRLKVKKVAKVLGVEDAWTSLILKHPSDAVKEKLEKSRRKARESWEKSEMKKTFSKGNTSSPSLDSDEVNNKILDQLIVLTKAVNKLEQAQREYSDYMTAQLQEIRTSSFKNSEKIDKLTEVGNKRQNYLVGELNKIKLSNHFNR